MELIIKTGKCAFSTKVVLLNERLVFSFEGVSYLEGEGACIVS